MVEDAAWRLGDALHARAQELVECADADACAISRVIGDVLIVVAHATLPGVTLEFGQGFLVSDYPATQRVLESGTPATLTVADRDADESEVRLLRELGFESLAMLPFELDGERWGLVELYRLDARPFDRVALAAAHPLWSLDR